MKLYLSSLAMPDVKAYMSLFAKKQPHHIVIIPTAWDAYPAEKSEPFFERTTKMFENIGFTSEYLDLKDYEGRTGELKSKLQTSSGCWIMGGNSFYLNYWMFASGFDKILPDLLGQGFVYGGESCGAVVAGKTLHGVELLDNPTDAPDVIWEGLKLVDYGIIPHWDNQKYADRLEQAYEEMRLFTPVKTLSDDNFVSVS